MREGAKRYQCCATNMQRRKESPPFENSNLLRSFEDFFDLDSIAAHLDGLDVITMAEFLSAEGGSLKSVNDDGKEGNVVELPHGRTNWAGASGMEKKLLNDYLEEVGYVRKMHPVTDFFVIPEDPEKSDVR